MTAAEYKEKIRLNLIHYRQKAGMRKAELARACGVTNPTVTNWENGRNSLDVEMLFRVSSVLGIPVDVLGGRRMNGFTRDEVEIIEKFRSLDDTQKEMILASIDAAYAATKKESASFSA